MELELKSIVSELQNYKNKIESDIKGYSDSNSAEIKKLKDQLDEINKQIASVNDAIKARDLKTIPGFDDIKSEREKFSIRNFIFACAEAASRGCHWKDIAPYEYEVISKINPPGRVITKGSTASNSEGMGYLIPNSLSDEIIELMVPKMPMLSLGATVLKGLVGNLYLNKHTQRNTGYWIGETETPTPSGNLLQQIQLSPKRLGVVDALSRTLSQQSRGVADTFIKQQMAIEAARTFNAGMISGTGSLRQPKGILNDKYSLTSAPGQAPNGQRLKVNDAACMVQALDNLDELIDSGRFGFLMHPQALWALKKERVSLYSGQPLGTGLPIGGFLNSILTDEQVKQSMGYPIATTTLMPKNLTCGTSSTCSNVVFGNFAQAFIGFWNELEIRTSDTAGNAFVNDMIYMVAFHTVDFQIGRESAFCKRSDIETNEANW